MKTALLFTLLFALFTLPAHATTIEQRVEQSRTVVKDFMGSLKHELKSAIKNDGAVAAIRVCNISAPLIAKKQSQLHNMEVRRTSLKVRNPDNAPDSWEKSILDDFEKRKAMGEPIKKMEHFETVTENGEQWFRYMKAIPTAKKPCLLCHGSNLKPAITATLDKLYPQDQAKGFKPGDIRGAFTFRQRIEP